MGMRFAVVTVIVALTASFGQSKRPSATQPPAPKWKVSPEEFLKSRRVVSTDPLFGLQKVSVFVGIRETPKAAPSVDRSEIQTTIELALRKSGLRVVGVEQGVPSVIFTAEAIEIKDTSLYAVFYRISLMDHVTFLRPLASGKTGQITAPAGLWESAYQSYSGFAG